MPVAGIPDVVPGRLTPWWEATRPPTSTRQWTSPSSTDSVRSRTRPSAMKIGSPSLTAAVRPAHPTGSVSSSPGCSTSVVRINCDSVRIETKPPLRSPSRSFGPGRSPRMPTHLPMSSPAARIRSMFSAWVSRSAWEKLSRKTSAPAEIIRSRIFGARDAGPTVATILVRRWVCSITGVPILNTCVSAALPARLDRSRSFIGLAPVRAAGELVPASASSRARRARGRPRRDRPRGSGCRAAARARWRRRARRRPRRGRGTTERR